MGLYSDSERSTIVEAIEASDADIRAAKHGMLESLADGRLKLLTELLTMAGPVQLDARRETVHEDDVSDPIRLRGHPLILSRRNYLAAMNAIVELEVAGLVVPHQRLDGGGGWSGSFEQLQTLPFSRRNSGGSIRLTDIAVPEARGSAYRLHRGLLDDPQQAHVLDPDLLLEGLDLPARVGRVAREAAHAFRRGLPLAAANLLGAVVEGAWVHAARQLAPEAEKVEAALSREPTPTIAEVQRRSIEALRSGQSRRAEDLASVAALIRDIRNYAIHADREHDPDLDGWLDETGVITLFGAVRRHLRLLADAVSTCTSR